MSLSARVRRSSVPGESDEAASHIAVDAFGAELTRSARTARALRGTLSPGTADATHTVTASSGEAVTPVQPDSAANVASHPRTSSMTAGVPPLRMPTVAGRFSLHPGVAPLLRLASTPAAAKFVTAPPKPDPAVSAAAAAADGARLRMEGAKPLAEAVDALWQLHAKEHNHSVVTISRAEYSRIYVRMARALYERDVDQSEAMQSAHTDWERDTASTGGIMTLACYTRSMLEVARQWTAGADWAGQAAFLTALFERIGGRTMEEARNLTDRVLPPESVNAPLEDPWTSVHAPPSDRSRRRSPAYSETERQTRARHARARARASDASNRIRVDGSGKVYTHTSDHAETMQLQSLAASGTSGAVTLYTPWQPSWNEDEQQRLLHKHQQLLPAQQEPVYILREAADSAEGWHAQERKWRAERPATARPMSARGVSSALSVAPEESFIALTTPTFPVHSGSSVTTRDVSTLASPHTHAQLQPAPPPSSRSRPHSAAVKRSSLISAQRHLTRRLSNSRANDAASRVHPAEVSASGAVIAFPMPPEERHISQPRSAAVFAPVSQVNEASRAEVVAEHASQRAAGHVQMPSFRSLTMRIAPAASSQPEKKSQHLETVALAPTPLLLLLSGDPVSPAVPQPVQIDMAAAKPAARPLSGPLVETLQHLADSARSRPSSAILISPRASGSRPATARRGSRRFTATPASMHLERPPVHAHRGASVQVPHESDAKDTSTAARPAAVLGSGGADDADTFLTSLCGYGGETEAEDETDPSPEETRLLAAEASADDSVFSTYVLPTSPHAAKVSVVQPAVKAAVPASAQRPASPFAEWTPFNPRSSSVQVPLHRRDVPAEAIRPLQSHPSLGVPCTTVPPTRATASRRTVPAEGVTLAQQLQQLQHSSVASQPQSWSWLTRLVAPEPPEELVQRTSLIPSPSAQQLMLEKRNELQSVLFDASKALHTWLHPSEPEEKEETKQQLSPTDSIDVAAPIAQSTRPLVPQLLFDSLPPSQILRPFVSAASRSARRQRQEDAATTTGDDPFYSNIAMDVAGDEFVTADPSLRDAVPSASPILLTSSTHKVSHLQPAPSSLTNPALSSAYDSRWERAGLYVRDDAPVGLRHARGLSTGAAGVPALEARSVIHESEREYATERARTNLRPSSASASARSAANGHAGIRPSSAVIRDPASRHAHRHHAHQAMRGYIHSAEAPLIMVEAQRSSLNQGAAEPVLSTLPLSLPLPQTVPMRISSHSFSKFSAPGPAPWWPRRAIVTEEHAAHAARPTRRSKVQKPQTAAQQADTARSEFAEVMASVFVQPQFSDADAPLVSPRPSVSSPACTGDAVMEEADPQASLKSPASAAHDHFYDTESESEADAETRPTLPRALSESAPADTLRHNATEAVRPFSAFAAQATARVTFAPSVSAPAAAAVAPPHTAPSAVPVPLLVVRDEDDDESDDEPSDSGVSAWGSRSASQPIHVRTPYAGGLTPQQQRYADARKAPHPESARSKRQAEARASPAPSPRTPASAAPSSRPQSAYSTTPRQATAAAIAARPTTTTTIRPVRFDVSAAEPPMSRSMPPPPVSLEAASARADDSRRGLGASSAASSRRRAARSSQREDQRDASPAAVRATLARLSSYSAAPLPVEAHLTRGVADELRALEAQMGAHASRTDTSAGDSRVSVTVASPASSSAARPRTPLHFVRPSIPESATPADFLTV